MSCFYVVQGPDKDLIIDAPDHELIFGRGDDCTALRDGTISRHHARVRAINGQWIIEDMGSSNGTYVNGVRISKPLELKQGDQIRLGKTLLTFSDDKPIQMLPDETDYGTLIDMDPQGQMVDSAIMAAIPSDQESILAVPEPGQEPGHLQVIYKLTNVISSIFNVDQLLRRVMEIIFEQVAADRGFILMLNQQTSQLDPVVVQYRQEDQPTKISTSKTIIQHVIDRKEGVLCSNAMADRRFSKGESVHDYALQSVICVPIMARNKLLGIIHIDSSAATHSYDQQDLRLITAIGYQTGLAVHNAQLYQDSLEAERLAATGQTVAGLSHYIKNILQGRSGGGDVMEMGLDRKDMSTVDKCWQVVNRNLQKIHNLMLNMLAFSKEREPRSEPIQINAVVREVLDLVQRQADDRGVLVITDLEEPMPAIPVDPDGVHQVVLNILVNALESVQQSTGVVTVRTGYDQNAHKVQILLGDNGPGIPEDEIGKIFELFHSSKGHGGTGLGLAVAKKIVDEHDGQIEVRSHLGEGTLFIVTLPVDRYDQDSHGTHGPASTV